MNSLAKSAERPFAAAGGLEAPLHSEQDPYRALDDLMAAIELLCPVWPQRGQFAEGARILM